MRSDPSRRFEQLTRAYLTQE